MPTGYVKKLAKKYHTSVSTAENEWEAAKKAAKKTYDENDDAMWGTTTNIFKAKMAKHHGKKNKNESTKIITNFELFCEKNGYRE